MKKTKPNLPKRPKTQEEKCVIVQTHYELICSCNWFSVDVCEACNRKLESMYPEIPFEGEGL